MTTDTIICFYRDIGKPTELDVIALWMKRWEAEGWKTRVLGVDQASKDPRYENMISKSKAMPCINGHEFEQCNFLRWLAFATLDGAVTDYDVFPTRPFPPQDFGGFICGDPCGGPGFIVGQKSDFSKIADDILAYQPAPDDMTFGKPHVSDMSILHKTKARYSGIINNICCYGVNGWENFPLVHFGNHYMQSYHKVSKADQIKTILRSIYPQ